MMIIIQLLKTFTTLSLSGAAFRFGSVFGTSSGRITGSQRAPLSVPVAARPVVRPQTQDPAPGSETPKFAHQRDWRVETGRFR